MQKCYDVKRANGAHQLCVFVFVAVCMCVPLLLNTNPYDCTRFNFSSQTSRVFTADSRGGLSNMNYTHKPTLEDMFPFFFEGGVYYLS